MTKLIGEFMGDNIMSSEYRNSWNLLMPVIEKIESLNCSESSYSWEMNGKRRYNYTFPRVEIQSNTCWIYFELQLDPCMTISDVKGTNKMEACYQAVVEFIKWYTE